MKTPARLIGLVLVLPGIVGSAAEPAPPAALPAVNRVGVYDSRVVAYAHFWSERVQAQREHLARQARAAREAGDTAALKKLEGQLVASQKQIHLQALSTAPAGEAMLALADKLPALQRELGVGQILSIWDTDALQGVPETDRIDVTDRLAREFLDPTEKQRATMESMKKAKPVPLWQAKLLNLVGRW